jgi:hypothetical protein
LKSHSWWFWGFANIDYDKDGDQDLVCTVHGPKYGLILKNLYKETGEFTFEDVTESLGVLWNVPAADNHPWIWDIDGDGDLDIFGLFDDTPTTVLLNQGGKAFTVAPYHNAHISYPTYLADVNHDGYGDVVTVRVGPNSATTRYLYDPKAHTFVMHKETLAIPAGIPAPLQADIDKRLATAYPKRKNRQTCSYIANHDLDCDGIRDLIVYKNYSYGQAKYRFAFYLSGSRNGTFVDRTTATGLPPQGIPLLLQDLNADGAVDILVTRDPEGGVYLNDGKGSFALKPGPLTDTLRRTGPYMFTVYPLEINNDRQVDFMISGRRMGFTHVFQNMGNGEFRQVLSSPGTWIDGMLRCDMNDDGLVDVVTARRGKEKGTYEIVLHLNETKDAGNYCKLLPRMPDPNWAAIGATIEVFTAGALGTKQARPYLTEKAHPDGTPIHIGLDSAATFDLRVTFPGKDPKVVELKNVKAIPRLEVTPAGRD